MNSDDKRMVQGIEDVKSVSAVWCVYRRPIRSLDGAQRRWERMSLQDNEFLEDAFRNGTQGETHVIFGRYTAYVHKRYMQAYFWQENRWPLVRGTWFWRDPATGNICPFGEADAATLDEAYVDMITGAEEGPIDCELVDIDIVAGTVQFVKHLVPLAEGDNKSSSEVSLESHLAESTKRGEYKLSYNLYRQKVTTASTVGGGSSSTASSSSRGGTDRLDVFCGYPTPWDSTSEERLGSGISQLVLAVHGIGEALYNRDNDALLGSLRFRGNCDLMRENLNDKHEGLVKADSGLILSRGRIEVLPLEWSEFVHSNELDRRLESVTLANLAGVRDFANLALSDVFLYTQDGVKAKILKELRERIRTMARRLKRRFGDGIFESVPVSFLGHSLGAVVLYDLFMAECRGNPPHAAEHTQGDPTQQISVAGLSPVALFVVGSPLAMFLTIRDPFEHTPQKETTTDSLSLPESTRESVTSGLSSSSLLKLPLLPNCRLFNIFHPFDAIAYRIEPLLCQELKLEDPAQVPYKGGTRVHVALRKSVAEFRTVIASFGEWVFAQTARSTAVPQTSSTPPLVRGVNKIQALNFNERIDWALQETAVESVSEWMSAVGSHFTYWRHDDVHNFIVNKLIAIDKARKTNFI